MRVTIVIEGKHLTQAHIDKLIEDLRGIPDIEVKVQKEKQDGES